MKIILKTQLQIQRIQLFWHGFKLNQIDPNARHWKYHEIPDHYVWQQSQQKWMPRKVGENHWMHLHYKPISRRMTLFVYTTTSHTWSHEL